MYDKLRVRDGSELWTAVINHSQHWRHCLSSKLGEMCVRDISAFNVLHVLLLFVFFFREKRRDNVLNAKVSPSNTADGQ